MHAEDAFDLRVEWGRDGARSLAEWADVLVVVDVLCFTTCVEVATSAGIEIVPYELRDDHARALARRSRAELGGPRGQARYSLSPESFVHGPAGTRVVLPSPNGAATTLAARGRPVLAGCLRNAGAVARHACGLGRRIAVVPAGERWPDGGLRPCLEDWLGAGAIIASLAGRPAPEALAAKAAFDIHHRRLADALDACPSARELKDRGFPQDVEIAARLDVSECVPVFSGRSFAAAAPS